MIKLTITRPDGSIYWTEHFNSQAECNNWLTEEQTRPYWGNTKDGKSKEVWAWTIVDLSPSQSQIDAQKATADAIKAKMASAISAVSTFDKTAVKSLPDLADAIDNILKILGVK